MEDEDSGTNRGVPPPPNPRAHRFETPPAIAGADRAAAKDRWRRLGKRAGLALSVVLLTLAIGVISLAVLPQRLVGKQPNAVLQVQAESAMRGSILQAIGGLALLAGLYYTGRSFRASRDAQITDRFSRSVAQLADESTPVRVGAILALERTWRDSPSDYDAILAVLLNHVRDRAALGRQDNGAKPSADVQIALDVLGRRPQSNRERVRLDFRDLHLVGASLWGGNFASADFSYSNLNRALAIEGNFRNAAFVESSLVGAFFIDADCRDAGFMGARLAGVYFCSAKLDLAGFEGADLSHADMACRYETDHTTVDKDPPSFAGARFHKANLAHTLLAGADLTRVEGLSEANLDDAVTDERTRFPAYLRKG